MADWNAENCNVLYSVVVHDFGGISFLLAAIENNVYLRSALYYVVRGHDY
jgi:N-methylhydantoinase A/oxoprolinase/acetone carboxylase beta subunit